MSIADAIAVDGIYCDRRSLDECPFLYRDDDEYYRSYHCRLFGELEHSTPETRDMVKRAKACFVAKGDEGGK